MKYPKEELLTPEVIQKLETQLTEIEKTLYSDNYRQFLSYLRGTYDILDMGVIFHNPHICERLLHGITLSEFVREHDVDRLRELGLAPAIDYLVRCDLAVFQGGDFLLPQAKKMVENMDVLPKLKLSREVLDEAINALHYDFAAMLARNLQAGGCCCAH